VQTFITQRSGYSLAFPWWYSYFTLLVLLGMLVLAWRLKFKAQ